VKRTFIVIFFLLASEVIFAQKLDEGMRFGLCGSQVNGDNLAGLYKAGLLAGADVSRRLSDYFSMQMEMVYIQKGSRKPTDVNNSYYRLRVNYVEVPLMVLFHASKKLDLTAGPTFGVLVFSEEDDEFGVYTNSPPFEKFELSGNFGIIYSLSDKWSFDARYSNSLTTIRPYPGTPTSFFDRGQYNVVIEFSFFYKF